MPIREINVDELAERLADRTTATLIDVRQPQEFAEGHVEGARLIPLNDVPDRLGEIPTNGEVLVVCRTGARSLAACEFLAAQGVEAVNVEGGVMAWIGSGREVVTGDQ